jgi:hypothetical protein
MVPLTEKANWLTLEEKVAQMHVHQLVGGVCLN